MEMELLRRPLVFQAGAAPSMAAAALAKGQLDEMERLSPSTQSLIEPKQQQPELEPESEPEPPGSCRELLPRMRGGPCWINAARMGGWVEQWRW